LIHEGTGSVGQSAPGHGRDCIDDKPKPGLAAPQCFLYPFALTA
jgi:hypothetical protein